MLAERKQLMTNLKDSSWKKKRRKNQIARTLLQRRHSAHTAYFIWTAENWHILLSDFAVENFKINIWLSKHCQKLQCNCWKVDYMLYDEKGVTHLWFNRIISEVSLLVWRLQIRCCQGYGRKWQWPAGRIVYHSWWLVSQLKTKIHPWVRGEQIGSISVCLEPAYIKNWFPYNNTIELNSNNYRIK
jgi:hypothetical protein